MIPIVVFSGGKVIEQLKRAMEDFFTVSIISDRQIQLFSSSELLIVQSTKSDIYVECNGVLVILDQCDANIEKFSGFAVIVDNIKKSPLIASVNEKAQYITCGMSGRDTINFSSIDEREVSVSLMRDIKDINGNIIEPFEVSISSKSDISNYSNFSLLCLVALLSLLGKNISGKQLVLK